MAQIRSGTASVTNGSAIVRASVGNNWTGVLANSLFVVNNVVYVIAANAAIVTGQWQVTLTTTYGGTTDTEAEYSIHIDFEPTYGLPLFAAGDTQVASLLNRAMIAIASQFVAGGFVPSVTFVADVNYTWGTNLIAGQNTALTSSKTGTLPFANAFVAGTILLYFDYFTSNSLAFGRTWSPRAGDTLQGGTIGIKPFSGSGTSRFITDGSSKWYLLDQHISILKLEDPINPAKVVTFDIAAVGPTTPRKIIMIDADVTLGSGGGGAPPTDPALYRDFISYVTADPAAPASGNARLFVRSTASNLIPRMETADAIFKNLQFALWSRQFVLWTPATTSGGASIGDTFTGAGTGGNGTGSPTTLYLAARRKTYGNVVTTLNQQVGLTCDSTSYLRSGGFFFFCRFGFETWTSGDRLCVGLAGSTTSALVTVEPNTLQNILAFCIDASGNAITFNHNATGTLAKETIPGQPTIASGVAFDAYIYGSAASGVTSVTFRLDDANTALKIWEQTVTTNLPGSTTLLKPVAVIGNAANTAVLAAQIGVAKIYCESR